MLDFSDGELQAMHIGHGLEAYVYKYKDEALKIYRNSIRKTHLSEKSAEELSKIKTERILMPRRMIHDFDTGEFLGYSLEFIPNASRKRIQRIRKEHFVEELDIIDNDLRLLADNGVFADDFTINNVLYNDNFYICDPGSFKIEKMEDPDVIYKYNVKTFNWFLIKEVFRINTKEGLMKAKFDVNEPLGEYIRETALPGEKVREYVKRMTK